MATVNQFLSLSLCFALWSLNGAFLLDDASCQGKCDHSLNRNWKCQCNAACAQFKDCCNDYISVCKNVPCLKDVAEVSRQMWIHDVNRVPNSTFHLDYQGHVRDGSSLDNAAHRLFKNLDETYLSKPTYKAYINLLNNYEPVKGVKEVDSAHEVSEINHFLDEVLKTEVMQILLRYLTCEGKTNREADLRIILNKLWFTSYPRSSNAVNKDTSGFEHVMVGEFQSKTLVNGFHGWLSFYLEEKANNLNYRGYVRKQDPHIVGASFVWHGRQKAMGTIIVGPSPEYEMAIFTLCYLTHGRKPCQTIMDGHKVNVKTYSTNGHVASAFLAI